MQIHHMLFMMTALFGCVEEEPKTDNTDSSSDTTDDSSDGNDNTIPEPTPYGPDNQWSHADAANVVEHPDCGTTNGAYACNFTLKDQFGDDVELYQFTGKVIVLDIIGET